MGHHTKIIKTELENTYKQLNERDGLIAEMKHVVDIYLDDQNIKDSYQALQSAVTEFSENSNILTTAILQAMNCNFHPQLLPSDIINKALAAI